MSYFLCKYCISDCILIDSSLTSHHKQPLFVCIYLFLQKERNEHCMVWWCILLQCYFSFQRVQQNTALQHANFNTANFHKAAIGVLTIKGCMVCWGCSARSDELYHIVSGCDIMTFYHTTMRNIVSDTKREVT